MALLQGKLAFLPSASARFLGNRRNESQFQHVNKVSCDLYFWSNTREGGGLPVGFAARTRGEEAEEKKTRDGQS